MTCSPRGENLVFVYDLHVGRDSSVGIATRYGLDGLGIESRYGRGFPHPSRPALVPTQPAVHNGYRVSFRGVNHPPLSSAEVKEGVELYIYFHVFMACSRANFAFTF
jgi:hypothetical protein